MKLSPFADIQPAPADPILGLTEAFNMDQNLNKVNLGVGVYQDDNGRVPILKVVKEASRRWLNEENTKSYIPIDGSPAYREQTRALILGANSSAIAEGRALTVQAPGGTGALKVGVDFIHKFFPDATMYISQPSWENHRALFEAAGFVVETYPYYNPITHGLDFDAMYATLQKLPDNSVVLMHACCHNPTGVDLSHEQWDTLVELFSKTKMIPFLDFAYQGLGDGLEEDAYAPRAFAEAGIPCFIASSFSKSLSLYRERVGALTVITSGEDETQRVLSQIKRVIRTNYSSPPSFGGQVAAMILSDPELRENWLLELEEMRLRIKKMRHLFANGLREMGVPQDFSFIERQIGMFSFTGLSLDVVQKLRSGHSIYIVNSSRVCVAAMNERNLPIICEAIANTIG